MKRLNSYGFTLIELMVFILVLTTVTVLALANIRSIRAENRDELNKTHINSVYFQLESFYEKNGYYPDKANADTLKGIDPASLKDTAGNMLGTANSKYTYTPRDCNDSKCKGFELKTELEKEAAFIKQSLHR